MGKMRNNKIIFSINVEDIQTVATEVYGRELTEEEVKKIIDPIGGRIGWYEAIEDAISSHLELEAQEDDDDY
jgi:hypothetical protein